MSASNVGGAVRIDNGPLCQANLQITVDEVEVTAIGATRPDPGWSQVDEAGHFHAWTKDGTLPTLVVKSERETCDMAHFPWHDEEECTVRERSWHECSVCGAIVTPGRVPDSGRKTMPGMMHWQVTVWTMNWEDALALQGRRVSITFHRGERVQAFGFAMGGPASGELGGLATVTLQGAGALGQR
jgi:hypothetical protein